MSPHMSRVATFLGAVCLLTQAATLRAQWLPANNCCPSCAPAPTCCPPPVTCMQPVSVPCYQTVPVTAYEPCEQTVMKPIVKTEYIDEPVTEFRPVSETRVARYPTCRYQPVTEFYPQTRDCGHWQTYYQCCPKMSPCQYDSTPGLFGWMNRTGYEMRMSFTPNYTVRRQYVPNYITTMVPVTRQVAHQTVQEVPYTVTRMEPLHTTRRVAVNRVDYIAEKITTQRAVTVFKTVPIGTSVAWVPFGSTVGTATAGLPQPDPISRHALKKEERALERDAARAHDLEKFNREREHQDLREDRELHDIERQRSEVIPQRKTSDSTAMLSPSYQSNVQVAGWVAHHSPSVAQQPTSTTELKLADSNR
jgi:hypothetical protein